MRDLPIVGWVALYGACCLLPCLVGSDRVRRRVGICFPVVALALLVLTRHELPVMRLAEASLGLLYAIKGWALMTQPRLDARRMGLRRILAFMTFWPGMDPSGFVQPRTAPSEDGRRFARGLLCIYSGLALGLALALLFTRLPAIATGWLGIAALLLTIHFRPTAFITGTRTGRRASSL